MTTNRASIAAVLLVAVTVVGGCASSEDAGESDSSSASSSDSESTQDFAECMEEQGVDVPDEPADGSGTPPDMGDGGNRNSQEMQDALEACQDLAPEGSGSQGEVDQSALNAFRDCMADKGVKVEATLESLQSLDSSKPKVRKALRVCQSLVEPSQ